jgi:hypothetical protein
MRHSTLGHGGMGLGTGFRGRTEWPQLPQKPDPLPGDRRFRPGRVEDGRGSLGHAATLRFPSPLIKPNVPISGIRLSDWLHREAHGESPKPRAASARRVTVLRLSTQQSPTAPVFEWCSQAHRQSPRPRHLQKRTRSQGPLLRRHYPASTLLRPCPTPAKAAA